MLMASETTPAVMNMLERPLCSSHGVMAKGTGMPTVSLCYSQSEALGEGWGVGGGEKDCTHAVGGRAKT